MDGAEHGVVYFSLGSVVKSSEIPAETVSYILAILTKIEQTVLWKWEDDQSLPELPNNVVVRKWFPQNDVLSTPIVSPSRHTRVVIKRIYRPSELPTLYHARGYSQRDRVHSSRGAHVVHTGVR